MKFRVDTTKLRRLVDPLDGAMWKCAKILDREILEAVEAQNFDDRIWDDLVQSVNSDMRSYHIARVATLLQQGFTFDGCVLVGVVDAPGQADNFYMNDGNHRLAATYIRAPEFIELAVATNNPDRMTEKYPFFKPV